MTLEAGPEADAAFVLDVLHTASTQPLSVRAPLLQGVLRRLSAVGVAGVPGEGRTSRYRYEALAELYAGDAVSQAAVATACRPLTGNPVLPPLYALLFHEAIFRSGASTLSRLNAFIRGAHDLFWMDIEAQTAVYGAVYRCLVDRGLASVRAHVPPPGSPLDAAVQPDELQRPTESVFDDLVSLACRYFFYYSTPDKLPDFIDEMTPLNDDDLALSMPAPNLVVREVRLQLEALQMPEVLERYLVGLRAVAPWFPSVDVYERERLIRTVYGLMTAGGPRYACRTTRRVAKTTLEILCPEGAWTRKYINVAFRLLHQHYLSWLKSLFLYFCLKAQCILALLVSFVRPTRR